MKEEEIDTEEMAELERLCVWALAWSPEGFAEEITASVWDRPAIETRDEFKAAILDFAQPWFSISLKASRLLAHQQAKLVNKRDAARDAPFDSTNWVMTPGALAPKLGDMDFETMLRYAAAEMRDDTIDILPASAEDEGSEED